MLCWHPTVKKINQWVESKDKEFAECENINPKLDVMAWLQKYIYTELHEIFFITFSNELHEWFSKLADIIHTINVKKKHCMDT